MSAATIKKYKLYFAWDESKAERWLESMARDGWFLQSVTPWCSHKFVRGEAGEFAYRIDFLSKSDPYRDQLYSDAGWERVTGCAGWQYWRKRGAAGPHAELFTDNKSLVKKYWRLLAVVAVGNAPTIVFLANTDFRAKVIQEITNGPPIHVAALIVFVAVLAFNTYGMIRLVMRIFSSKRIAA